MPLHRDHLLPPDRQAFLAAEPPTGRVIVIAPTRAACETIELALGLQLETLLEREHGKETRSLVLGHLQRGGTPTTFDRLLALRFGTAAVRFIAEGKFGMMAALLPPDIVPVPLEQALGAPKQVPLDSDTIATARELEISLGD